MYADERMRDRLYSAIASLNLLLEQAGEILEVSSVEWDEADMVLDELGRASDILIDLEVLLEYTAEVQSMTLGKRLRLAVTGVLNRLAMIEL